ncbi:helix-turn-helix transcriptional regulator [Microvirga sp. STS02]|uniref:helix-turn-helix domain-containing protein n=1 Tax=Hymenobacter negativus TaxID=2795026 RepID=UPI0018DD0FE5|nr:MULTISPECIES: helix-turn-helix transcriptional regulator [Bacteria]MBH8567552.1 helix-turn-helix transcriptional regulator [Hymenobacter negativus]MBR7207284.1 helix-turn-helix transcriptional regulator [Microvirga sp. STS02]
MKSLEDKIKKKLSEQGMTIQRLATESGISEPTLHAILNRDDAKLSQLEKIAEALGVSLSYFLEEGSTSTVITSTQTGFANQAGSGNSQKIRTSTKAPAHELAVQLDTCLRDVESLKNQLALANALVAAKDETITLLRGSYNRPN